MISITLPDLLSGITTFAGDTGVMVIVVGLFIVAGGMFLVRHMIKRGKSAA